MKTARDYPVTFGYLQKTTINGKPYTHRGNDRKTPTGTPVQIGSKVIGLTGNTGLSTGPHLHTQAGTDAAVQNTIDPNGHEFKAGTVTSTRTTDTGAWGKYVTVKTGNVYVTYAHLSKVNVKKGDKVNSMADAADVKAIYKYGPLGRTADASGVKHYTGKKTDKILKDHAASAEGKSRAKAITDNSKLAKQVPGLKKQVRSQKDDNTKLVKRNQELAKVIEIKDKEIAKLKANGNSSEDITYIRSKVDAIWEKLTSIFRG